MIASLLLQGVALVGGTVHSMVPGQTPQIQTIWIEDQTIRGVGADLVLPEGCERIDIQGLHVIPGLIDGMVNHDPEHDALYLASGVTFVRDSGNDLAGILSQKQAIYRDRTPGPDLYICGQVFDGMQSSMTDSLRLANAHVVPPIINGIVERLAEVEASLEYLSFMATLPQEPWQALVGEARKNQMPVWGPLPNGVDLEQATRIGQAGFFGMQALLPAGLDWRNATLTAVGPQIEILAESGAGLTPIMNGYARMLAQHSMEDGLAWLSPLYESPWRVELEQWSEGLQGEARTSLERVAGVQSQVLLALHQSKATLIPGSAAPNSWIMPGVGLVDELQLWAAAGIPNADVLAYATQGAATVLGVADRRGSIEVGKLADLVVLGSDPLKSLQALKQPEIVVQRGRLFERSDLMERLDNLAATQTKVREELARDIVVAAPSVSEGDLVLQGQAETWALGNRIAVEHFMVRRLGQDRWLYATRMVYPATAGDKGREVQLAQIMNNDMLEQFDLRISDIGLQAPDLEDQPEPLPADAPEVIVDPDLPTAKPAQENGGAPEALNIMQVRGRLVEGTSIMSIERRLDGMFLSNLRVRDVLASVDVSLILNGLVAARHFPQGTSFVVSFEGQALEPFTDKWHLAIREGDHLLQLRTTQGNLAYGFDSAGRPLFAAREQGKSRLSAILLEGVSTFGGPGLGLPPVRVFVPEATEASAPK
ncbi:MAG: amidohydrolase family protein [Planctomycetes bacterium]|nr:amidohydrolase family protein [Planctomycetota bacterium]